MAGSSDTTTIAQLRQNPSLRAMYSYEVSGDYIKVVLRNGVDTAGGIEKMGIVPGLSQISTDKYLEANGIAPGAVEMVSATPTDMPALLSRGDIDGYVLWEPWPATALSQGSGHVVAVTGDYDWFYHHWPSRRPRGWSRTRTPPQDRQGARPGERTGRVRPADCGGGDQEGRQRGRGQTVTAVSEIDFGVENLTDKAWSPHSRSSTSTRRSAFSSEAARPHLSDAARWYQEDKQ